MKKNFQKNIRWSSMILEEILNTFFIDFVVVVGYTVV